MQSGRADAAPAKRRSASAAGRRGRTRTRPPAQRQGEQTRRSPTPAGECGRHRFPSVRGSRTWDAGRRRRPARQGAAAPRARRGPERPRNPAGRSTHGSRYAAPFRRPKPRCDTEGAREERARTRQAASGGKPRKLSFEKLTPGTPSSRVNGERGTAPSSGNGAKATKVSNRPAANDVGPAINDGDS